MKTPEEYAEIAKNYFEKGMNCSQAVACAFAADNGLDVEIVARMTSSFGGGMAHLGEVCGAVSGAFAAYGLLRGYNENNIDDAGENAGKLKSAHYKELQKISTEFVKLHKTYLCRELLKNGENQGRKYCKKLVEDATVIVAKQLEEK